MTYLITAIVPDFGDAFEIFKDLGKKKKIETTTMKERGKNLRVTKKKKITYVCDNCLENRSEGQLDTESGRFICNECLKKKKK